MDDDKKTLSKKPVRISKAPDPINPIGSGGYIPQGARTLHRGAWKRPNWNFWKHMPKVETWQACALALNFDPDSLERSPQEWMAGGGDVFQSKSFPSDEVMRQHENLLRVLAANRINAQLFTPAYSVKYPVRLPEFAAWCAPVVRDLTGGDIPEELAALAGAKVEAETGTSPSGDDVEEQAPAADDHDETLAALFDLVPVAALEKMFPANGKWKNWAEKAKANGLIDAREGTAKFNPYKAGAWFVHKGMEGWDNARLYRTLEKNLPARSRNDAHLLTGDIE